MEKKTEVKNTTPKKKTAPKKKVADKKKATPKKKETPKKKGADKKTATKKKSGGVPALPRNRLTATGILDSGLDSHKITRLRDNPIPDTLGSRKKR